jgi:hypothetical protein
MEIETINGFGNRVSNVGVSCLLKQDAEINRLDVRSTTRRREREWRPISLPPPLPMQRAWCPGR